MLLFPAAPSQIPSSGIWTAVASLRYRIETVGSLWMIGAERPMCRSVSGIKILAVLFLCERRFIPPHQSLTRQLPPKGKPSVRCANMANMALHCGLPLRFALVALSCSAKGILQKGFPLGGKKTASSLSRKRLMRGDQSPLTYE